MLCAQFAHSATTPTCDDSVSMNFAGKEMKSHDEKKSVQTTTQQLTFTHLYHRTL